VVEGTQTLRDGHWNGTQALASVNRQDSLGYIQTSIMLHFVFIKISLDRVGYGLNAFLFKSIL
jgi:hypothetical protein